ncbi:hypothetical protein yc1106_01022 [Curvularia clavata]|uniref:DUF7626 domain-containing protein n=1 Tax=Curvularia clavata TaxID=95742 RepID=A0A9Q9DNC6_CURCL|nr:hypothetical protein yc1106_01022 [Curvularia clavata]
MVTHNEVTDSFGGVSGHDLELDGYNGPKRGRDTSEDLSDIEHDNIVSGRKRKRSQSCVSEESRPNDTATFNLEEDNDSSNKQPSCGPNTQKRNNIERSTFSGKRISDELDSDDELMLQMRENGFTDRQIAQRLQKEGRVRYDEKSISTRIVRIRQAKAEKVEFLLKEGYKEWKYEEDKLLLQAYALADIEINYEIERIRAWRFRKVSDHMRRLNKNALFSANACRERYNALVEGTARIPTALDDDPEARRVEMEAYRVAREKSRHKEQTEQALKEAAKAKLKAEKKSHKAQKAKESANKRARRAEEKAQRAAQRAEKAKIRAARAREVQESKAHRKAQITKETTQKDKRTTPTTPSPIDDPAPDPASAPAVAPAAVPIKKTKTTSNTTVSASKAKSKLTPITPETLDPRTKLSLADLKKLCKDRNIGLPSTRNKTTLLQSLENADERQSLNNLKNMCREKGLNVTGTKTVLKYRLALATARDCESFGKRAGAGT